MRILISGGWGYGNLGDELILSGTLAAVSKAFPGAECTILSYDPTMTKSEHGVSAVYSSHAILGDSRINLPLSWISVISLLLSTRDTFRSKNKNIQILGDIFKSHGVFIQAGGGYFNDLWFTAFPSRVFELLLAKKLGLKVGIVGQTLGPFRYQISRRLIHSTLNLIDWIYVRDESSVTILKELGLKRVSLCADTALLAPEVCLQRPGFVRQTGGLVLGATLKQYSPWVSSGGRHSIQYSSGKFYLDVAEAVAVLAEELRCKVSLSPSTIYVGDYDACRIVASLLQKMGIDVDLRRPRGYRDLVDHIKGSSVYLSMNMHHLIAATAMGIPAIGISYHFKVNDFMKQTGQSNRTIGIQEPDIITKLISIVRSCVRSLDSSIVSSLDAKGLETLRRMAFRPFEEISQRLGS